MGYNAKLDEIVVSFRGSANIVNWATNIEIIERPYPGVTYAGVQAGFYDSYIRLENPMFNAIS